MVMRASLPRVRPARISVDLRNGAEVSPVTRRHSPLSKAAGSEAAGADAGPAGKIRVIWLSWVSEGLIGAARRGLGRLGGVGRTDHNAMYSLIIIVWQ